MDSSSESSGRGRRSKVVRLIEEYDLQGIGAELERYWTADEDRRSLRDLADYFNRHLLEAALDSAGVQHLDGETENTYRLLTDDDVSSADRTRVRRRLERDGVDVDELESDFVTYQAIRTYLKDHRGAEYTPDETDPLEREKANAQQLRGRMAAVTEGKLEQLRDGGHLTLGEFRTLAEIRVVCEDCNTQFDLVELLERGGCNCSADE
ncbi:rod-determining factor RdfA [Natronomonas amylolytica]|uniref:rod-determining factor RdfA n=1 Tax=Natronomonas amylolytica TaxID=3108498 RepID=UPI0030082C4A